jgi:geranylgeranyl pyrophosphate synthase
MQRIGSGPLSDLESLRQKFEYANKSIQRINFTSIHHILGEPIKFALKTGGKRLRPITCMLCAEVVGGDYRSTKNAFLALELLHNGTLVHDDIVDEDIFRRGRTSVHTKFGGKRAVLTGDSLFSLGLIYAAKTENPRIIELLSETALKMIQGVALQTFYRRKILSENQYLNINYLKSGSLFEAAAVLGALSYTENLEDVNALTGFGKNFGNAYQIRDDICGVHAEGQDDSLSKNDLLNGDLTLPFIHALKSEFLEEDDKRHLMSTYLGHNKKLEIEEIQEIYEKTGALEKSILKMKSFAEMSGKYLDHFKKSEAKECLRYLLECYYLKFNPRKKVKIFT